MSLHLNLSTGKFLNSSTLFKLSDALLLDVSSGEIVMSNLLVPRAGVDLFKLASLDLNFAQYKSLTDRVSGNNLVTFSRASSGTYVGSDGLIKTSPVNLLLYSNGFTTWVKSGLGTISSTTTAPDGTATATTFSASGAAYIYRAGSCVVGESYVGSIWIKGNANATLGLRKPGTSSPTIGAGNEEINVTTEWQRFTAVTTSANTTDGRFLVDFRTAAGSSVPPGFEVSLWQAQIEEGTTATDYIPTGATISGAPRFDHDPVTGESLGLLIEEVRTNLITNSNNFPNGTGLALTTGSTAPDGSLDGVRVESYSNGSAQRYVAIAGSISANQTISVFIKPDEIEKFWLSGGYGTTGLFAAFDLSTSPPTITSGSDTAGAEATPYTNGWFRLSFTSTVSSGGFSLVITPDLNKTSTIPNVGDDIPIGYGFFVFGAQQEAGTFPTSYIPTTSAAVTRAADVATIGGANFSSWFNQSEGTFFAEANRVVSSDQRYMRIISNQNSVSGYLILNTFNVVGSYDGVGANVVTLTNPPSFVKCAMGYNATDVKVAGNGTLSATVGRSGTYPFTPATSLRLGPNAFSPNIYNGHISRLAYFPTRKTDQELIDLTN